MPVPSNDPEPTAAIPDPDEPGTWLVQLEPPAPDEATMGQLPAVATGQRGVGPQLFALVDACDPERVYHYGIDLGAGAFTVRCDPASQTAFGKWISMQTAFERLDGIAGGPGRLALVVFDSAPAVAMMALGPALAAAPTNELQYQPQWNLHSTMLDAVDRNVVISRDKYAGYGHDPHATEDQHVKIAKQRSDPH